MTKEQEVSERDTVLRELADKAAEIVKLIELEKAGVPDRDGGSQTEMIDYLANQISNLARELDAVTFEERHPAEYAEQQRQRERDLAAWRNDPENDWLF